MVGHQWMNMLLLFKKFYLVACEHALLQQFPEGIVFSHAISGYLLILRTAIW